MNKFFLILGLSIFFINNSLAQAKVGITVGLNISNNLYEENDGNTSKNKNKTGFRAGIVTDFNLNDKFTITPELLFSQLGSKGSTNTYLRLNYLQLPVNFSCKFSVRNGSKLFVFAGPYVGYGLSAKLKASNSTLPDIGFGSGEKEYNPLDFGVNVGVGYQYEKMFLKIQFNPGLSNLVDEKKNSLFSSTSVFKNTSVAVSAGYYFTVIN